MSDDSGTGGNPFGDMPFFGDFSNMANMFGGGGDPWAQARQIAASVATGGESEPNVDPSERIAFEQLARVAELHVSRATGLTISEGAPPQIRPATRREWALDTLDAYRPLLEAMAETMSQSMTAGGEDLLPSDADIPGLPGGMFSGDFMAQIMKMLAPMMLSMTSGSMAGQLARTSLGAYNLPIPRPPSSELLVVHANIAAFIEEWSVPTDDVRLWVCLHEYLHHAILRKPHVAKRMVELITQYVSAFESNTEALGSKFGELDMTNPESMGELEGLMGDPEALMGVVQSDAQRAMLPEISALLSAIVGYVDHMMDTIGSTLIPSYSMISEALRRRRVTADPTDRFLQRMLGLELDQGCYARGRAFVDGVIERGGDDAIARLWHSARELPTPNEIVAPGLWLARIEIEDPPAPDLGSPDDSEPDSGDSAS
jgi:putative hydrolase